MKTPIVLLKGDQLEIDFDQIGFDLDRPQLSICPQCSSDVIKLADGCPICGWNENQKLLGDNCKKSLAIPCTVKQPKQPERQGVIKQDLGDRFLVYLPDSESTVTVPKLFVYPDFPQQNSKTTTPPSKIPPTISRRKKGDGTGYIYRRTITRKGNQYQEFYYRYRDESGKLRSKYIPQRLLDRVQEAESRKLPVADILVLLGGGEINRGEPFDTLDDECLPRSKSELINRGEQFSSFDGENLPHSEPSDELISLSRGEPATPPSKRRRKQGQGTGYIECKPIKRSGQEYKQYWYHYEEWWSGDIYIKSSKYIPKKLEGKIFRMNNKKAPVEKILRVLESKSRRGKKR